MLVISLKFRHTRDMVSAMTIGKKYQVGISLIELMIALTLGLLIMAGLTTILINNVRTRNDIERANQKIENGRYAMQLLTDDLRNVGYLAEFNPGILATPTAKPDPCAFGLPTLSTALPIAVQGYDNPASAVVPTCLNDVKPNTDILVVRRASACATAFGTSLGDPGCDPLVSGAPYFQASTCSNATELNSTTTTNYYRLDTNTANLDRHQKNCTNVAGSGTLAPIHQYRTHIYFIANNDKNGDGIPTLKRAELVGGATGFTIVPLVEGIQDLQIEYGLDNPTSTTGAPTVYTANPDTYLACTAITTPPCTVYWQNTVSAKIYLLARNVTKTAGYQDTKSYSMGLNAAGTAYIDGPYYDQYMRNAYESVVRLNNTAGRNTP